MNFCEKKIKKFTGGVKYSKKNITLKHGVIWYLKLNHKKKSKKFKASTFQIAILLLFNDKTEYLVKDIVDLTQIKMDTLVQVLAVLFKSKLLVSDEEEIEENEIQLNTPVRLFANYKK